MREICKIEPINLDPLECRDIPGAESLWDSIWADIRHKQEEILTQVLSELLKREPTIEDYKKCTLGFYQDEPHYLFSYDGAVLGKIEVKLYPEGSITFTPNTLYAGAI